MAEHYDDHRTSQVSVNSTQKLYKDEKVLGEDVSFGRESSSGVWKGLTVLFALVAIAGVTVGVVCGTGNCSSDSDDDIPVDTPCEIDCKNPSWGYTETDGPRCWANCEEWKYCADRSQSPIDLDSGIALKLADFEPLSTLGYNETDDFSITNNGHTEKLKKWHAMCSRAKFTNSERSKSNYQFYSVPSVQ
ncbi:hypothetical protein CAPTEDRAFT_216877 [Capitella teleta]|uniref:Alpha-carbonic anhydrase domain-containing protein n=1 Tax=Capitella teleta TaxID=283909 RepID=R7TGU1_CAPTE|nr:hypothetical protein CAPTEDRAFT_216877 [Capitella teleta]|eukprot:ELT92919.1 hypothetical protein CAPTEDRAFT_216877 [Capitella teleta]